MRRVKKRWGHACVNWSLFGVVELFRVFGSGANILGTKWPEAYRWSWGFWSFFVLWINWMKEDIFWEHPLKLILTSKTWLWIIHMAHTRIKPHSDVLVCIVYSTDEWFLADALFTCFIFKQQDNSYFIYLYSIEKCNAGTCTNISFVIHDLLWGNSIAR